MKKIVIKIILIALAILVAPVSFLICGFITPSKYQETYYGELSSMVSRLRNSTKKKIVFIGNSAVSFGVDSALIEEELSLDGLDYDVCNFGLYGSIGTKAMMELSTNYIKEGDLVIFTPELNQQSMSLYFSPMEMWYACDSDFSLLKDLGEEKKMFGSYIQYVQKKLHTQKVSGSGVYSKSSFDSHCDMKNAEREYNIMVNGFDENNLFSSTITWDDEFTSYVNDYYASIKKKGADMVYSFAPMNRKGIPSEEEKFIDDYYQMFSDKLDFLILGNPHSCVMDYEWFYDSNVHLNASGMKARTISLVNDLKLYFKKITPVRASMPSKPAIPEKEKPSEKDIDSSLYLYETKEDGILITGLTEEGKKQKSLSLPSSVYAFSKEAFQNDTSLEELTLPSSVKTLYDESFKGCSSLKKLILLQEDPSKIAVGYSLLQGAESCHIYVSKEAFSSYSSNYFWGHYANVLEAM